MDQSAKTRYIKLQSSTDRVSGTLAAPTFDLTASSFLQNCRAAQLLSCGFTNLTPNIRDGESAVLLQTNDVVYDVPEIATMRIRVEFGGSSVVITIPAPPAGQYTPLEWAAQATTSITEGIRNAGSFDFSVEITLAAYNPVRWSWQIIADFPPAGQVLDFFTSDEIAPFLGIQSDRFRVFGSGNPSYPGPLITFPQATFVGTIHRFVVPTGNYNIDQIITALNSADVPFPALIDPVFAFVDDRIDVSTARDYPLFRVLPVTENRGSGLAPILGFHSGYVDPTRYFSEQRADSAPGLYGLVSANIHLRPIATGQTVTVSSKDGQALEVSVIAQIPCADTPFGQFVNYDFSRSGESYMINFEDDRDLSRIQVRLRTHQGALVELSHPGITLFFRVFLR
jgi:hypothetical protein